MWPLFQHDAKKTCDIDLQEAYQTNEITNANFRKAKAREKKFVYVS